MNMNYTMEDEEYGGLMNCSELEWGGRLDGRRRNTYLYGGIGDLDMSITSFRPPRASADART